MLINTTVSANPPPTVTLRVKDHGTWRFFVNEQAWPVRGAGGAEAPGLLEKLAEAGGNTVRTWSIETLDLRYENGERYIDRAHRLGLMVVPGLWVGHERHGFDYANTGQVASQRERLVAAVHRYKDHPALLAWGIGNEMEGPSSPTGSLAAYREVEQLARLIKAEDPRHPVMTVIAFNPAKIPQVLAHCPSIDVLGLNAYGSAPTIGAALKEAGWTKPFLVTEFGVSGFWEVPATSWGAPIEPASQAKASMYFTNYKLIVEQNEGHERCLGTFAFLWGWKQERTATWFGMFLPGGEKLPTVDAMTKAWTGHWPSNRCPKLSGLHSSASAKTIVPGSHHDVHVEVVDPEGDDLRAVWTLRHESWAKSEGGDAETAPPEVTDRISSTPDPLRIVLAAPEEPGAYRLFVTVYDVHQHAATANFPFQVLPVNPNAPANIKEAQP